MGPPRREASEQQLNGRTKWQTRPAPHSGRTHDGAGRDLADEVRVRVTLAPGALNDRLAVLLGLFDLRRRHLVDTGSRHHLAPAPVTSTCKGLARVTAGCVPVASAWSSQA